MSERVFVRIRRRHVAGGGVEVVGPSAPLAHVPLVEVGDLGGEVRRGSVPVRLRGGGQRVPERVRGGYVGDVGGGGGGGVIVGGGGRGRLAVHLHVLPQRTRVRVGLVAAAHLAVVRLVAGVDVGVLFPVAAVGEASVASVKLTFEGLLTCEQGHKETRVNRMQIQRPCGIYLNVYLREGRLTGGAV